jgi:hypothetical protein
MESADCVAGKNPGVTVFAEKSRSDRVPPGRVEHYFPRFGIDVYFIDFPLNFFR